MLRSLRRFGSALSTEVAFPVAEWRSAVLHPFPPMCAETFYDRLPVLDDFAEVAKPQNYRAVPEGWSVAVAAVQDSTGAFERGLYKAVNVVGVSVIAAVINALGERNIPYVFAGTGAILCVPGSQTKNVARALAGVRRMARECFGLRLCVGLVPVEVLLEQQRTVKVACYRPSELVVQTVFLGRGLQFAEAQVEQYPDGPYAIPASMDGHADFSGLKCQWVQVPSRKEEVVVLLVKPSPPALSDRAHVYEDVLGTLKELYGERTDRRPVDHEDLTHTSSLFQPSVEQQLQAWSQGTWRRALYWGRLGLERLRRILPVREGPRRGDDHEQDTSPVAARTDFETLEGMLREVVAGTAEERSRVETYLREQYKKGRLIYGHSCSESALLTCLMFREGEEHIHFVDGAKGGYARAARALRSRERALERRQS